MNFKTKAKQKKEVSVQKQFPKLMISNVSGSIYMITTESTGMKLHQGSKLTNAREPVSVGVFSDDWTTDNMVDYHGTIKIKTL